MTTDWCIILKTNIQSHITNEKSMSESVLERSRSDYRKALDIALENIINRLRGMPEVEKVILFGSYNTGRRDLFTDLDILVVMDTEQDFIHRTAELYSQIQADVDLDLLVYTPEEFERNQGNRFLRHVLATGKVVYEK